MPAPVSSTTTSTKRSRSARPAIRSLPPPGMAWQALSARFCRACCSVAGSARSIGRSGGHSTWTATPDFCASALTMGIIASTIAARATGLEFQLLRPRELQQPLQHLVQAPQRAGDDGHVLARGPGVGGPGLRRPGGDLLLHELEVDDHRGAASS